MCGGVVLSSNVMINEVAYFRQLEEIFRKKSSGSQLSMRTRII